MCRQRITLATGLALLLCTLVGSMLLMRMTMRDGAAASDSFTHGGTPPAAAAALSAESGSDVALPPGSFAAQLRKSWKVLHNLAKKKTGSLVHAVKSSSIAKRFARHGSTGASQQPDDMDEDRQMNELMERTPGLREALAAEAIRIEAGATAAAHDATPAQAPAVVATSAVPSVPSATGAPAFLRSHLRSSRRQLPATPVDLLQPGHPVAAPAFPTTSQMLHMALNNVAGQTQAAGAPLSPAPSVAPATLMLPPAPDAASPLHGLVIGTRFWSTSAADLPPLQQFLSHALPLCSHVIVALNVAADAADTIGFVQSLGVPADRLTILPVTPWIGVSTGLNALALHAASALNASRILFQSIEVTMTEAQMIAIVHEFDAHPVQLVVGPVLDGHVFEETKSDSLHRVDGHNAPWNTAALWHLPSLLQTGFMTLADGFPRGVHDFGQEEVPTMVLLQSMARAAAADHPRKHTQAEDVHRSAITLLHVGEVSWSHSFASASARKDWHTKKMQSKMSRAAHHLSLIGMDVEGTSRSGGRVAHRIARLHHTQDAAVQQIEGTEAIVAADADPAATDSAPLSPSSRSSYAVPPAAAAGAAAGSAPRFPSGVHFQAQHVASSATHGLSNEAVAAASPAPAVVTSSREEETKPAVDGSAVAPAGPQVAASPAVAAAAPIPVIPLPSRLHRKIVAAHAAAALRTSRREDHSADEPMAVKIRQHIPIGRRRR